MPDDFDPQAFIAGTATVQTSDGTFDPAGFIAKHSVNQSNGQGFDPATFIQQHSGRPIPESQKPASVSQRGNDAQAAADKSIAAGVAFRNDYNTELMPSEEDGFQSWKDRVAPKDSGLDYDYRGAYKAGITPSSTGHWPDTFKKPNHPTFSDQSIYAKFRPELAGHWDGDKFISSKPTADSLVQFPSLRNQVATPELAQTVPNPKKSSWLNLVDLRAGKPITPQEAIEANKPALTFAKIPYKEGESQIVRAGKAVTNTAEDFVSGLTTARGLIDVFIPPVGLADIVMSSPQIWQKVKEAEKTPAGSPERWEAGLQVVTLMGTLGAGVKAYRAVTREAAAELKQMPERTEPAASDVRPIEKPSNVIKAPEINQETGASKPPPPTSIVRPDTPPGDDPVPHYAMRTTNVFRRWWDDAWPRDLATTRVAPDSPVISEHQRLIKSDMDYMEHFTKTDWWKALRARPEEELIDIEDTAVKNYRGRLATGSQPKQAYEDVVSKLPSDVQAIMRHRDRRIPIEIKAAQDLGVEPPDYTGDPYLARLTNEEGKNIVDVHAKIGNLSRQIRSTIGSFDNSRVYQTIKDGIKNDVQYEPIKKSVFLRELTSARLEATADMLRNMKGKVLFDSKQEAFAASPTKQIAKVRGFGGNDYWARTRQEAKFLEQNLKPGGMNPLSRMQQLINTYIRNPSLINPLPHTTKNMFFKYVLARVGNTKFKFDTKDFSMSEPSVLRKRFDQVMPFTETGERMPQLKASEIGTWAEKLASKGLMLNKPSTRFIFAKADPAMRYSLWKSYIRKGMGDQEAANHVWLDLIRYDANSGAMSFWKNIPFNYFVPWRVGTYVTLAKQLTSHPIRTLLFLGSVEYLREIAYRKTGWWVHLPSDYLDAPLAEAIQNPRGLLGVAATTLIFGPGGGQAPNTISAAMAALNNDPAQRARVMNMFWGLSQLYNIPREYEAYRKDGDNSHLVKILASAALSAHSSLKYEPRRLGKWLPEWMPGLEKSKLVATAEALQERVKLRQQRSKATYDTRHGISASLEFSPEEQQLMELERSAGRR